MQYHAKVLKPLKKGKPHFMTHKFLTSLALPSIFHNLIFTSECVRVYFFVVSSSSAFVVVFAVVAVVVVEKKYNHFLLAVCGYPEKSQKRCHNQYINQEGIFPAGRSCMF